MGSPELNANKNGLVKDHSIIKMQHIMSQTYLK